MKKKTEKITEEIIDVKITDETKGADDNKILSSDSADKKKETDIEVIAERIKKEKGLKEVFITEIEGAGLELIWKRLSRKEYREFLNQEFSEDKEEAFLQKEEAITRIVLLYPENVDEIIEEFGAVAEIISSEAMVKSGFGLNYTTSV